MHCCRARRAGDNRPVCVPCRAFPLNAQQRAQRYGVRIRRTTPYIAIGSTPSRTCLAPRDRLVVVSASQEKKGRGKRWSEGWRNPKEQRRAIEQQDVNVPALVPKAMSKKSCMRALGPSSFCNLVKNSRGTTPRTPPPSILSIRTPAVAGFKCIVRSARASQIAHVSNK